MAKYKIAWLPGDGIGVDVLEAAKIVLDKVQLDAEYLPGDIGWEFWCKEGDAFPSRTIELLKNVDAAMFGAITSKPAKLTAAELAPALQNKGLTYRSPIVRMRQLFDLYICLRPCKGYPGNPLNFKEGIDHCVRATIDCPDISQTAMHQYMIAPLQTDGKQGIPDLLLIQHCRLILCGF